LSVKDSNVHVTCVSRFRVQGLGYSIFAIAAWAQTVQGSGFRVQGAGVEFFLFAIAAWGPIVGDEAAPGTYLEVGVCPCCEWRIVAESV